MCRQLVAVVGQPHQLVGVTGVTAMVFFLANCQHSELPEADRLRVGKAEYGDALELAGQTLGAVRERIVRDDEDEDSRCLEPTIAMVEKDKFQTLVAMVADFHVVWWVEVEERATACRKVGFEGAALRGWDAARSRSGCSICIKFDGRSLCREVLRDFEQCGSIASAWIHGEEWSWRYQELPKVARFFDGQRVMTEFQTPCIAHGSAPFFWDFGGVI